MKTCKTISVIISKQRDASNINATAFCIYAQQSLHIEWVFTAHLKSTRELGIRFLLLKQGIHFSYGLDFIFWEVKSIFLSGTTL